MSAVNAWLSENGLEAVPLSPAGDWLSINVPVSKANDLFDTEFSVFTHTASGQKSIRALSYSIPTDLVGHLDLVHPTVTCVLTMIVYGDADVRWLGSPIRMEPSQSYTSPRMPSARVPSSRGRTTVSTTKGI